MAWRVVSHPAARNPTWLDAPTLTSARPASFRLEVEIAGKSTLVIVDGSLRSIKPVHDVVFHARRPARC